MKATLLEIFDGSMRGRTPRCTFHDSLGGHISKFVGIEITDSPYVVCNMENDDTNGY